MTEPPPDDAILRLLADLEAKRVSDRAAQRNSRRARWGDPPRRVLGLGDLPSCLASGVLTPSSGEQTAAPGRASTAPAEPDRELSPAPALDAGTQAVPRSADSCGLSGSARPPQCLEDLSKELDEWARSRQHREIKREIARRKLVGALAADGLPNSEVGRAAPSYRRVQLSTEQKNGDVGNEAAPHPVAVAFEGARTVPAEHRNEGMTAPTPATDSLNKPRATIEHAADVLRDIYARNTRTKREDALRQAHQVLMELGSHCPYSLLKEAIRSVQNRPRRGRPSP